MKIWRKLLNFELRLLSKEFAIIMTLFLGPLIYPLWVGSVYVNKDIDSTPLGIVDMDGTSSSRTFVRFLDAHQKIAVTENFETYQQGLDALNDFQNYGFVFIPKGFESELKKGKGADVSAYINTTRFLPASDLTMGIQEVCMTMGAGIRMKSFEAKGMPSDLALKKAVPIQPEIKKLFNPTISYGAYILPAVFFLVLHQTLLMGIGQSISVVREENKFAQLREASGGSGFQVVMLRNLFYMFIFAAYTFLIFAVIYPVFELRTDGHMVQAFFYCLLSFFCIASLGTFVGSFFKTQYFWMIVVAFTSYPFFLASGYVWPTYDLPYVIQLLAKTFPCTPLMFGLRHLTQMGEGIADIPQHFIHLLILTIIYFTAAVWRMNYLLKRSV